MKKNKILFVLILAILLTSGWLWTTRFHTQKNPTTMGRLEAITIKLTAMTPGKIVEFPFEEGDAIAKGGLIAQVDPEKLETQRDQQTAQAQELAGGLAMANAQIDQANAALALTHKLIERTETLLHSGSATPQNMDELQTQLAVQEAQRKVAEANRAQLKGKQGQLAATIKLTEIQLRDATIRSPITGTLLNQYIRVGEVVAAGSPVAEVADLSHLSARVYLPLSALSQVRLGATFSVHIDGFPTPLSGKIRWISSEAEFTPKTILTPETRTTLVYAIKLDLPNPDGKLKIGMPVEVGIR